MQKIASSDYYRVCSYQTCDLDLPEAGIETAVLDEAGRVISSVMMAVNFRVRKGAF